MSYLTINRFVSNYSLSEDFPVFQPCAQRLGAGKVQEFETFHCPTLRSFGKARMFPNPLDTCILLAPC